MVVNHVALVLGITLVWIGVAALLDALTRYVANKRSWSSETTDRVWGMVAMFYGGLSLIVYAVYF